jgi:hypothetical protein
MSAGIDCHANGRFLAPSNCERRLLQVGQANRVPWCKVAADPSDIP